MKQSLALPAWDGTCRYEDTYCGVLKHDRNAVAQSNFELVPRRVCLFVCSSVKWGADAAEIKTSYHTRLCWAEDDWAVTNTDHWPWQELSAWPSAHPLKSMLWLDEVKTRSDSIEAKQKAILNSWLAGRVTDDEVSEIIGVQL